MSNIPRRYALGTILAVLVLAGPVDLASAQRGNRGRGGQQGEGFAPPGGMMVQQGGRGRQPNNGGSQRGRGGFNPFDPIGVLGGNRRNDDDSSGPNQGMFPGQPQMSGPNGGYLLDPRTNRYYDPNTGQFLNTGPPPAAQPLAPSTGTRVYDAQRRVFIQETGQYTGEVVDPQGRIVPAGSAPPATLSTQPPAPRATPPPAPATPPSTASTPAPRPDPPKPSKPPGPPENTVVTRIQPATSAQCRRLAAEVERRIDAVLRSELDQFLRPFLWNVGDQDRALELARRRGQPDAVASLNRALAVDKDPIRAERAFADAGVAPADSEPLLKRLELRQAYGELLSRRPRSRFEMRDAMDQLVARASRAGMAEDEIRPVAGQLEDLAELREALELEELGAGPEIPLSGVAAETPYRVVRSPGHSGPPVTLGPETLLVAAGPRGKLSIGEATAEQAGLPILAGAGQALPESDRAPASDGLSFKMPPDSGAELSLWVLNPDGVNYVPYNLKPGTERTIPGRGSARVCFLDGKSPKPTPWQSLSAGSYVFQRREGRWQIFTRTLTFTLDNTANAHPFQYRIGDQVGTVPPGGSVTLNRTGPATLIEFSRGNQEVARRLVPNDKGRYAVRLDSSSEGLDLYRVEEPARDERVALDQGRVPPRDERVARATARSVTDPEVDEIRSRYPLGEPPE